VPEMPHHHETHRIIAARFVANTHDADPDHN
jgi:hypothetical protein